MLFLIALKQINFVNGAGHFDRGMLSPGMFPWLHLIYQITVNSAPEDCK